VTPGALHWLFETLGYLIGFRIYLALRRSEGDALTNHARWSVIAAAALGGAVGSKLLYLAEDPSTTLAHLRDVTYLLGGKSIVG
jgi:phosphatidylglycerol---prolipoprotein diacylglyceryl transferase